MIGHSKHSRMSVLRNAQNDCTGRGIDSVTVHVIKIDGKLVTYGEVRDFIDAEGYCEDMADEDVIVAVPHGGPVGLDNPPALMHVGSLRAGKHVMAGGNFAYTSNGVITTNIGYEAPMSIHDRVE